MRASLSILHPLSPYVGKDMIYGFCVWKLLPSLSDYTKHESFSQNHNDSVLESVVQISRNWKGISQEQRNK